MFIRCAPQPVEGGIERHRIHVKDTLTSDMMRRVEARVFQGSTTPTINLPDPSGEKLSKVEALAWTYLFAAEDVHILAERLASQRGHTMNAASLMGYRERVAQLMYTYATEPKLSDATRSRTARHQLMREGYPALGLVPDPESEQIFGQYLSDAALSQWYDTFLPACDALDSQAVGSFNRTFSQLSIEELRALSVRAFLPHTDRTSSHFRWVFEGEEVADNDDKWTAVLRYETRRCLWLIVDIKPPRYERALEKLSNNGVKNEHRGDFI